MRRDSTYKRTNSKHDFAGCFDLFWWLWPPPEMMGHASPNAACSGLHSKQLDDASWQVLVPYHSDGCNGHWCCCAVWWTHKQQLLASAYGRKPGQTNWFFCQFNDDMTRTISTTLMFSIQCEDLLMWRFSNAKLSILYNLHRVGEVQMFVFEAVWEKN